MNHKLITVREKDYIISAVFKGNEMVQVNADKSREESILGNIYVGRVKNIVKNINAAFVEIAGGRMCYLSLDEAKYPIFVTSKKNSKIVMGDELLVQVSKEDIKTKAPMITVNLNFTGKYVVLIHGKSMVGVSSKIEGEEQRRKLKSLLQDAKGDSYGFVVRTNAAHAPAEQIMREVELLKEQYHNILEYGIHKTALSLLYQTPPGYICNIRDGFAEQMDEIITDDREIYENMASYLKNYQTEDLPKLRFYEDGLISLGNLYGISLKLEHALREKVWLKSGGTIIIQPTEALTVIDVNTGKAISGKKNVQETFFKINMEAAREIAKQLRLRNLSGIILIDFIDMEEQDRRDSLMRELESLFKEDPIKTTLVDMTALNLVEITRKKVRKPLREQIGSTEVELQKN
jgi:Ribonucleases G and E